MFRTYKRKLILNKAQKDRLDSWLGACRVVYNLGMEVRNAHYSATGKNIHKYELMKQVTQVRKDVHWIRDVSSDTLNKVIDRLDLAYIRFYKTYKNGGGFPKFASKKTFKSIPLKDVSVNDRFCTFAKMINIKMVKDSPILGNPKCGTIVKEPTGYFICIVCDNVPSKFNSESQAIGLDVGISQFCVYSNGKFISNPKHFKKYEKQLRIENRALARKVKNSKGWINQAKKLSKLHHKIKNVRTDFLHKESTKIAKLNSVVYMEDLNIGGMVKSSLSKQILDVGWGKFKQMISYKTSAILVNPKYTSQTCNACGSIDRNNRVSQSEFICTSCGNTDNADFNAAKNILSKGIAISRKREALACA